MAAGERSDGDASIRSPRSRRSRRSGPRGPGTDAERRAARHLAGRAESLGRSVRMESFFTWPRWPGGLGAAARARRGRGRAVGVGARGRRGARARGARGSTCSTPGRRSRWLAGCFGRRASQNVISPAPAERPGALVLVAHIDSGRTGFVYQARPSAGSSPAPCRRSHGCWPPCSPAAWRALAGVDATALTAAQFALTVVLLVALALAVDIWLSPAVTGRRRQRIRGRSRPARRGTAGRHARALRSPSAAHRSAGERGRRRDARVPAPSPARAAARPDRVPEPGRGRLGHAVLRGARGTGPGRARARAAHQALRGGGRAAGGGRGPPATASPRATPATPRSP